MLSTRETQLVCFEILVSMELRCWQWLVLQIPVEYQDRLNTNKDVALVALQQLQAKHTHLHRTTAAN